jgi:hypothetical protein
VVGSADRDGELVACLAAHRARLGKGEVCGSDGTRPHTRQGCRSMNLRWSLLRRRTVLPKAPTHQCSTQCVSTRRATAENTAENSGFGSAQPQVDLRYANY